MRNPRSPRGSLLVVAAWCAGLLMAGCSPKPQQGDAGEDAGQSDANPVIGMDHVMTPLPDGGDAGPSGPCAGVQCPPNEYPSPGVAACACVCDPGYVPDLGDSTQCVFDICHTDGGCADGTCRIADCDPHATCQPEAQGEHTCQCEVGWTGPGTTCLQDYCYVTDGGVFVTDNGNCPINTDCASSPSGVVCNCIPPLVAYPLGNTSPQVQCIQPVCDFDGGNPCDMNAICANTPTGAQCTCEAPFLGDGLAGDCAMPDNCLDAGTGMPYCDTNATCSYDRLLGTTCTCNMGYQGTGIPGHCSLVPICESQQPPCDVNAHCTDTQTPPYYRCACNTGYDGDGLHGDCTPHDRCTDTPAPCDTNATCTFTGPGTYSCLCNGGFAGNGTTCHVGYKSVAAGGATTCAIRVDGTLWCWGDATQGAVCNGMLAPRGGNSTFDIANPTQVGSASDWIAVTGGESHTCGIRAGSGQTAGTLWCCGWNAYGQLDVDTFDPAIASSQPDNQYNSGVPVQVGTDSTWTQVAAGVGDTCGIKSDGTLWCWGADSHGDSIGQCPACTVVPALPDGGLAGGEPSPPVEIPGPGRGSNWTAVALGADHICAIRDDGSLWCWGRNDEGELGDGTFNTHEAPEEIGAGGSPWVSISAGEWHTCGTRADGSAWCWGDNQAGDVGVGVALGMVPMPVSSPGQVLASPSEESAWTVSACGPQGDHVCALKADGSVWCWGEDYYGELGVTPPAVTYYPNATHTPIPLESGRSITGVTAGDFHSCALDSSGQLWCWGHNQQGQLGNGTRSDTTMATPTE